MVDLLVESEGYAGHLERLLDSSEAAGSRVPGRSRADPTVEVTPPVTEAPDEVA